VSIYLNDDNLKPEVNLGTPGHAVLKEKQWFILLILKSDIPKNKAHEIGDPQHSRWVICGRYICVTSEDTEVHLRKNLSATGVG